MSHQDFIYLLMAPKPEPPEIFLPEDCENLLAAIKKYFDEVKRFGLSEKKIEIDTPKLLDLLNSDSDLSLTGNVDQGLFRKLAETRVEKLTIAFSRLSNAGFLHLMDGLRNTQITALDVCGAGLELNEGETNRFRWHLLAPRLTYLSLTSVRFKLPTSALSFIQTLLSNTITFLNLSFCLLGHDAAVSSLFSIIHRTSITTLIVRGNKIGNDAIKLLSNNLKTSKLEKLDLSTNHIEDAGIDFLAAGLVGSKVVELKISANHFKGGNRFFSCLKNTKIQTLNLSGNQIERYEMFCFPDFLKDSLVETLNIRDCKQCDDLGEKMMQNLKFCALKSLTARENQFAARTLSAFAEIINDTKLRHVTFGDILDPLSLPIPPIPLPDFLTFTECLTSSQLDCFVYTGVFNHPPSVTIRSFVGWGMETVPIEAVCRESSRTSVMGTEVPRSTHSEITFLFRSDFYPKSAVANPVNSHTFSSLTQLNLCSCLLQDTGVELLAKHLKEIHITHLDLSRNDITSVGAKALAQCFKGSCLLYLDLRVNKIENDGYVALADSIKGTFITFLDISNNPGRRNFLIAKVLWENRIAVTRLVHVFKKIAPQSAQGHFCFDFVENTYNDTFINDLLDFCKTLSDQPAAVCAIAANENIPFSVSEILDLMSKKFRGQFAMFIARRKDWNFSQQLSFLIKVEELGLSNIVESLLWNRPVYMIDDNLEILHPYVYKLLEKYKQPLYKLGIEPEAKEKIISYFSDHPGYPDDKDVISMLSEEDEKLQGSSKRSKKF